MLRGDAGMLAPRAILDLPRVEVGWPATDVDAPTTLVAAVKAADLPGNLSGPAVGEALRKARIAAIALAKEA